jgi:hypothetical protein
MAKRKSTKGHKTMKIVESGVKHYNPNPLLLGYKFPKVLSFLYSVLRHWHDLVIYNIVVHIWDKYFGSLSFYSLSPKTFNTLVLYSLKNHSTKIICYNKLLLLFLLLFLLYTNNPFNSLPITLHSSTEYRMIETQNTHALDSQFYWWKKPEYPEKTTDLPHKMRYI